MPRRHRALTAFSSALAVPALVAGLALAAAAPASAATDKHDDAAKDTVVGGANPGEYVPNPQKFGDVVRLVTRHDGNAVRLTTSFRTVGAMGLYLIDRIVTPDADYTVTYDGIFGGGTLALYGDTGAPVTCDDLAIRVSDTKDTAKVTVPRSCIGRPSTVRTGSLSVVPATGRTASARSGKIFTSAYDDARRDGSARPDHVKVGPKVAHR